LNDPVYIIGAGWAGMAAALELYRHDIPVTLLEAGQRVGGRARTVTIDGLAIDNGQHLLIGAYTESLRLMAMIGLREQEVLLRQPLSLTVMGQNEDTLRLQAPPLPAPLHLVAGLLFCGGVPWRERLAALRMARDLRITGFQLAHDISVAELLQRHRQGKVMCGKFWEPLCVATLNTPIDSASAQVFLNVLRDSFARCRRDAELLIPRVPLGTLFCETAAQHLQRHPANRLISGSRVTALHIAHQQLQGIEVEGTVLPCRQAILATSPAEAQRLLAPHPPLHDIAARIAQLGSQPITTLYLHYPPHVQLPEAMIGLHGGTAQWLTDRRHAGQKGLIAVTISATGAHMTWDRQRLCEKVIAEIRHHFPHWPPPRLCRMIREKRATFACTVTSQALRPPVQTPVAGLWLAGDYVAGDYPATLEGAVRSGVQCATAITRTRPTRT
jgi:hydroxysqualene dehydroxylase